jgi:hypothetical protein
MKFNLGNPYMRSTEVEVKTNTKNNQRIANINDVYNEANAIGRLQKDRYIEYRKDADTAIELARKARKEPTAREFNEMANKRRMKQMKENERIAEQQLNDEELMQQYYYEPYQTAIEEAKEQMARLEPLATTLPEAEKVSTTFEREFEPDEYDMTTPREPLQKLRQAAFNAYFARVDSGKTYHLSNETLQEKQARDAFMTNQHMEQVAHRAFNEQKVSTGNRAEHSKRDIATMITFVDQSLKTIGKLDPTRHGPRGTQIKEEDMGQDFVKTVGELRRKNYISKGSSWYKPSWTDEAQTLMSQIPKPPVY